MKQNRNCILFATGTSHRTPIYYPSQVKDAPVYDLFINRSGMILSADEQQFPSIPQQDELKVLLVGGVTQGTEQFEQAFTIQQIESIRLIQRLGNYTIQLQIPGVSKQIKHIFNDI